MGGGNFVLPLFFARGGRGGLSDLDFFFVLLVFSTAIMTTMMGEMRCVL